MCVCMYVTCSYDDTNIEFATCHGSIYNPLLQRKKQCRTNGMNFISTPAVPFYMNFPEPN